MSCVTGRGLVDGAEPDLALGAAALVGVKLVGACSLCRAAAYVTSLTEGARLGARLRVESLTARVSSCHAAMGAI